MVGRGLARGRVHRRGAGAIVGAVLVALLAGCGGGSSPSSSGGPSVTPGGDPVPAGDLSFSYQRIGKIGEVDQALVISSKAAAPLTLTAGLVALDEDGKALSGVKVSSIFGTERGDQVLMPGQNLDVLVFTGSGAGDVRDVRVRDVRARTATGVRAVSEPVVARVVNVAGHTVAARFAGGGVRVENANDNAVDVRVVFIIWSRPGMGESQQAVQVLRLGGLTRVPAQGEVTLTPSAEDAATIEKFGTTHAESIRVFHSR